ncbi:unnamed protein product [Albugo candida]|uniref:Uncharacterized protein n=1 Tax=Albugo candida TaxID=65357 RepID=A0A024FX26_9STRA|nr:unnamed protein product [Albugo candida]|eukprot:CCI11457.1 unnamed protein product [Albugo candida]
MVEKAKLDISSIAPIPSKSVVARYYITGRQRSRVSAGSQDNFDNEPQRDDKAQEESNAVTDSNTRRKRSRLYEGNNIDDVEHYADQWAQKNGLMQSVKLPPSDGNEPQGKDEDRDTRRDRDEINVERYSFPYEKILDKAAMLNWDSTDPNNHQSGSGIP